MKSWSAPSIPQIQIAKEPLRVYSTAASQIVEFPLKDEYQMYVCGITPYDATHLGHAATYLTFDIINRYLRALGATVNYIQNITDIDDPLLERAKRDGVDWVELAHSQIDLYRQDMQQLRIIPPQHYEGAVDAIPDVVDAISTLSESNLVYKVADDLYLDIKEDKRFGSESHLPHSEMLKIFAERGGDPSRPGKRDALDPLLWLNHREGEPSWPSKFGAGRPGWHIECAAIALKYAKSDGDCVIDIQGGGSDLIFPHHEMSASQVRLLTGKEFAHAYVHAGLIGLDGEKMSKSKGNLLFVSKMISEGVDPMAIRWALLKRHYRQDYIWQRNETESAIIELDRFRLALKQERVLDTQALEKSIVAAISMDLDTPRAISEINRWAENSIRENQADRFTHQVDHRKSLIDTIDALLGITLAL